MSFPEKREKTKISKEYFWKHEKTRKNTKKHETTKTETQNWENLKSERDEDQEISYNPRFWLLVAGILFPVKIMN